MAIWASSGFGLALAATGVVALGVVAGSLIYKNSHPLPERVAVSQTQQQVATDKASALEPVVGEPKLEPAKEVAAKEPAKVIEPPVEAVMSREPAQLPDPVIIRPRFDVLRVEKDGSAVIAGHAAPGSMVAILLAGRELTRVTADAQGAFVVLYDIPPAQTPREMDLVALDPAGDLRSENTMLVLASEPEVQQAPVIVATTDTGIRVVQASPTVFSEAVTLDSIRYDTEGAVVVAGRGGADQFVRIYVNERPVETEAVLADGNWQIKLTGLEVGIYQLRVDELDAGGRVTSRVESPFKREIPELLDQQPPTGSELASSTPVKSRVTVQPGHSLWALAQDRYGDGARYVQIFHANSDSIRDPDMIFPGQVFDLPQ